MCVNNSRWKRKEAMDIWMNHMSNGRVNIVSFISRLISILRATYIIVATNEKHDIWNHHLLCFKTFFKLTMMTRGIHYEWLVGSPMQKSFSCYDIMKWASLSLRKMIKKWFCLKKMEWNNSYWDDNFMYTYSKISVRHADSLVQDCSISIANALEILQSRTKRLM